MMREKKHRLPKPFYQGEISAAFTLCLDKTSVAAGFSLRDSEIADCFTNLLSTIAEKRACMIPVYCFMPDHQHLIITGKKPDANLWQAVVDYKQKTGFWMSVHRSGMKWQKDFYDHILRTNEKIAVQIRYILDNPVRKGLVKMWEEYPFKGAIGCKLEDILDGIL